MSGQKTVLVVDDEPVLQTIARGILAIGGYRVLEAATGEAALAILEEERPAAMLLDIQLPGIDGWEVLRRLRESARLDSLAVILFSANADPAVEARARDEGCRAFVPKPFSVRELLRTVDRVLIGG